METTVYVNIFLRCVGIKTQLCDYNWPQLNVELDLITLISLAGQAQELAPKFQNWTWTSFEMSSDILVLGQRF